MRERGGKVGLCRLQWFFSIIFIAFVIAVACFVNEAESVRESKAVKNSKSNKEKVKLFEKAIMKGVVYWQSNAGLRKEVILRCFEDVRSNGYRRGVLFYRTRFI